MFVVIVDKPELGIIPENLKDHMGDGRCQHLTEDNMCAVHHYEWYKETPCYAHTQIEENEDCLCRMGEYLTKKQKNEKNS
jgi:hypothetical protein